MATSPLHDLNAFSGSPARNWRLNILKKQESAKRCSAATLLPSSSMMKFSLLNMLVNLVASSTPGTSALNPGAMAPLT